MLEGAVGGEGVLGMNCMRGEYIKENKKKKKTSSYTYDTILRNGYTIYTVVLIVKE